MQQGPKYFWFGSNLRVSGWQLQSEFIDGYDTIRIDFMSIFFSIFYLSNFKDHTGWQIDLGLIQDYRAGRSYQVPQIFLF